MGLEENIVQNQIMKYLNQCGVNADFPIVKRSIAFRINSKGIKGRKSTLPLGFPDIMAMITIQGKAIPFFIEVKAPNKKCTNKDQLQFITDMESRGAWATWANDLEVVKNFVRTKILSIFANDATKEEQSTDTIFSLRQKQTENFTKN